MKIPKFLFAALTVFIFSLSPKFSFSSPTESVIKFSTVNISSELNSIDKEYKYVRVLKSGIWWIYVYEGSELIDVYPE